MLGQSIISTSTDNNHRSNNQFGCTLQFIEFGVGIGTSECQFGCALWPKKESDFTSVVLRFLTWHLSTIHRAQPGPWRVALERCGLIHYSDHLLQKASWLDQTTAAMISYLHSELSGSPSPDPGDPYSLQCVSLSSLPNGVHWSHLYFLAYFQHLLSPLTSHI